MSTDVDVTGNGGAIDRPIVGLVAWLATQADQDADSMAFTVTAAQLDKMLAADTETDFWDSVESAGTVGGKEMEDVELTAYSFTVHKSGESFKAPLGHFIVIHATRVSDGSEVLVNTGSPLIIGMMRWHQAKDRLPVNFVIRGSNTPNGRRLWPERLPGRMMQGSAE